MWHRASFWQPLQPWFIKETAFFFAKAQNLRIRLVPDSGNEYRIYAQNFVLAQSFSCSTELLFTGTQSFCIPVPVFPTARYHREIPLSPYAAFATCIFSSKIVQKLQKPAVLPCKISSKDRFVFSDTQSMRFFRVFFCLIFLVAGLSFLFPNSRFSGAVPADGDDYSTYYSLKKKKRFYNTFFICPETVKTPFKSDSYYVVTKEEFYSLLDWKDLPLLLNNDIFAFYGNPRSKKMGILGEHSLEDLEPILLEYAGAYDAANGESRGVIPALYLIYGTCLPEGKIGYLPENIVKKYIDYAAQRGWLVFLDHQIGRYSVESAMEKLLHFLKYPNVHLALDPEWSTDRPMEVTGSITGEELNSAQKIMSDYISSHNIPGNRILVVHQFKPMMIKNPSVVSGNFTSVNLVHCADGFGNPPLKRLTYKNNTKIKNMPVKAFKLFFKGPVEGAGYDDPLMTPEEVYTLEPKPRVIMYQ